MIASVETIENSILPAENTRLFGHQESRQFLAKIFATGRLHHALLLEGEEGIGKATLAFHFANHILNYPEAENAPEFLSDPDPDSPVYRQIASGASHNLIHVKCQIDPKTGVKKSTVGVDNIRKIGKFFSQTSGSDNWRIAIIDVADELTISAANAMLKILEEPPKRAMFLVLSHLPGRLLPTIRSRCLSLRLKPLSDEELIKALEHLDLLSGFNQDNIPHLLDLSKGSVSRALTVIHYGGAECIQSFYEIIDPARQSGRKAIHKLCEKLAGRGQDMIYHFFIDYMVCHIMNCAKQAAFSGQLAHSAMLADLSEKLQKHKQESDIYNLDRKQTLLTLFSMIIDVEKA